MNLADVALERFAAQEELNLSHLKGESFQKGQFSYRIDPYEFCVGKNVPIHTMTNILSHTTHLMLSDALRFSNSLITLANIINFAKNNRIHNIILPYLWYIKPGTHRVGNISIQHLAEGASYETGPDDLILKGRFFYGSTLKKFIAPCSRFDIIQSARDLLLLDVDAQLLPDNHLVVHVRSGDVFLKDGANVGYGQPPLAFYKKVIAVEKPEEVSIVFENTNNPVIKPLIEHLKETQTTYHLVSSGLESDINYMLKAKTLVVGRGSFMPGVTSVSKNIKKVYFFQSGYDTWGRNDIEVIKVTDKEGTFQNAVLASWKNTTAQRELMLTYPTSSLTYSGEEDQKKNMQTFYGIEIEASPDKANLPPQANELLEVMNVMKPVASPFNLIRIGGSRDGAYLVPDDLKGIKACFSPGVNNFKNFEDELVHSYDISSYMCDYSSDVSKFRTKIIEGKQFFIKKWLDVNNSSDSVSLENWVKENCPNAAHDLLLQMDIEGAEFRNILATPPHILKRFRILLFELHGLVRMLEPGVFYKVFLPFFKKLSEDFVCVHAHPNNVSNEIEIPGTGFNLPNLLELTFLRKDRLKEAHENVVLPILPHPLDLNLNVTRKPPLILNEAWSGGTRHPEAEKKVAEILSEYKGVTLAEELSKARRLNKALYKICQSHLIPSDGASTSAGQSPKANQKIIDLAAGKTFALNGSWSNLPTNGTVKEKAPFFFHTDINWDRKITIDLQNEYILEELVIRNRTDVCQERASFIFYQQHISKKIEADKWAPVHTPDGFLTSQNAESRTLLGCHRARYITIYSPDFTALHFSSIQVLGYDTTS